MNFTHAQISELLLEIANSENGTNTLRPFYQQQTFLD